MGRERDSVLLGKTVDKKKIIEIYFCSCISCKKKRDVEGRAAPCRGINVC
jgi:hypothetical protein